MTLGRKHFDDMDDFADFDDKIDVSCDADLGENGPNPLSWRRLIIEKAVNNVKKAQEHKTDIQLSYKKGDLVFDEEASKFGRVVESRPGFLNLSLIAGGKLVRRVGDDLEFIREHRQKLTLREMAEKLFLSEIEVIALLNQLELETDSIEVSSTQKTILKTSKKKDVVVKAASLVADKKKLKIDIKNTKPLAQKTIPKLAAKKKSKNVVATKEIAISFTKLLPKGATTDPVMDPNGYIQQNFLMMNNRELATATGLSEHTIRRKLGEWNLKRKDFVNKA